MLTQTNVFKCEKPSQTYLMVKLFKKLIANKHEAITALTNFQLCSDSSIILVWVSSFDTHFGYIAVGASQHTLASAWWP